MRRVLVAMCIVIGSCGNDRAVTLDMADDGVRSAASAWNAACGEELFVDSKRATYHVVYVEDPNRDCRFADTVSVTTGAIHLCAETDREALLLHTLGHFLQGRIAPRSGHHSGDGVMGHGGHAVTLADRRVICDESGRCCP